MGLIDPPLLCRVEVAPVTLGGPGHVETDMDGVVGVWDHCRCEPDLEYIVGEDDLSRVQRPSAEHARDVVRRLFPICQLHLLDIRRPNDILEHLLGE